MATAKAFLHSIDDFENYAAANLPKVASDYFNGGSLDGATLTNNRTAFQKYYIQPRALRDVSNITTSLKVFDHEIPFPVGVAPAAMQRMAHPDGELATARGCGTFGTVMGLSTFSTTSLEDVKIAADTARKKSGECGNTECVLQLYVFENRKTTEELVRRAEASGFKALVLTVDTPFFGRRLSEMRNAFKLPPHLTLANFDAALGVKTGSELRTDEMQEHDRADPVQKINRGASQAQNTLDSSLTWEVIKYLKSITNLPVWIKGIMCPEDAALAVQHEADAIIVSNHGGRQLDGSPPTLAVIEQIARVVDKQIPVHFDGGIRRGSDVFKALCLGADFVWIGRPALWAITYDGERGLTNTLQILEAEFRQCMGLAGCVSLSDLGPDKLVVADAKL